MPEHTTADFTLDEFREIVRSSVGPEEAAAVTTDAEDVPLADLGIDSLGVLEIVAQLRSKVVAGIADEDIDGDSSARRSVEVVRSMMAKPGS